MSSRMSWLTDLQNDSTTKDLLCDKTVEKFWIHIIGWYIPVLLKLPSARFRRLFPHIYASPASQQSASSKSWVQLGGGHGDVSPPLSANGWDIFCHIPHIFLFRICNWRAFKNKSDICHIAWRTFHARCYT